MGLMTDLMPNYCPGGVYSGTHDQAVCVLTQLLGSPVTSAIHPGPSEGSQTLFVNLLQQFNSLLLGAGLIIFAITLFIGTLQSAHEGQFLGRQWHSIWTPLRLIIGLLFVVPLKSGLCFGQKIILYAVLLGVGLGTHVWQKAVKDVFDAHMAPPIPSYVGQLALHRVQQAFLLQSAESILSTIQSKNNPGSSQKGTVTVSIPPTRYNINEIASSDQTHSTKQVPPLIAAALQTDLNQLCSNLFPGQISACEQYVSDALSGGEVSPPKSTAALVGQFNLFIGASLPSSGTSGLPFVTYNGSMASTYNKPSFSGVNNGDFEVTGGSVTLDFDPGAKDKTGQPSLMPLGQQCEANTPADAAQCMQGKIQTIIQNDVTQDVPVQCSSQSDRCDLSPIAASLNAAAQVYAQHHLDGSEGTDSYHSNWKIEKKQHCYKEGGVEICRNTNDVVLKDPQQYFYKDMDGHWQSLDLNNSWWVAGQSYLIMDNQLSSSLRALADYIQGTQGGVPLTPQISSHYTIHAVLGLSEAAYSKNNSNLASLNNCQPINYGVAVDLGQAGSSTGDTYENGVDQKTSSLPLQDTILPMPNQNDIKAMPLFYSCGNGQVASTTLLDSYHTVSTNAAPIAPLPQDWDKFLNSIKKSGETCSASNNLPDTSASLYCRLQDLPSQFQMPFFLVYKGAIANGTEADQNLAVKYMTNMLNVMVANNIVSQNNSTNLPIKQVLDTMFKSLLSGANQGGAGDGAGTSGEDLGDNVSSIMQAVYNMGEPPKGVGLVAGQFSMIQKAQTAGISMIMTAINSVSEIFDAYKTKEKNLQKYIQGKGNEIMGTSIALNSAAMAAALVPNIPFVSSNNEAISNVLSSSASLAVSVGQYQLQDLMVDQMANINFSLMWLPVAMLVLTSLFTAGLSFALLVPLMPYILFWGGQIAWILGVLEALVAAPIVMLGLAHPGGHELIGHSTPAVKMLLGVLFRPVLMVLGMMAGILLTYIVIQFSAVGFHTIANGIINAVPATATDARGILACILLLIYCSFMVMAFTKCFSAIYVIPEKVMQWIGAHGDKAGAEELQQISGKVDSAGQQVGQSGGSAMSQGMDANKQEIQQSQQSAQSQMGVAQAEGQIAGGAAKLRNNSSQNANEAGTSLHGADEKGGSGSSSGSKGSGNGSDNENLQQ